MRRQRAARTIAFRVAKHSSMGLRSDWQIPERGDGGLDGALDAGERVRTEVSAMMLSQGCRVGTSICSI